MKNKQQKKPVLLKLLGRINPSIPWDETNLKQFYATLSKSSLSRTKFSLLFILSFQIVTIIVNIVTPNYNLDWLLYLGMSIVSVLCILFFIIIKRQEKNNSKWLDSTIFVSWIVILAASLSILYSQVVARGSVAIYIFFSLLLCTLSLFSSKKLFPLLFGYTAVCVLIAHLSIDHIGYNMQYIFIVLIVNLYIWGTQKTATLQAFAENHFLALQNTQLTELAYKDLLTGLYNRRGFRRAAEEYSNGSVSEYALYILDIDNFKEYNDLHYHDAGDRCLKRIADALTSVASGRYDIVCRYGGEEFVICLANVSKREVVKNGYEIQNKIRELNITFDSMAEEKKITVSIGAAYTDSVHHENLIPTLQLADVELYHAKNSGKDCISYQGEVFGREEISSSLQAPIHSGHKTILVVDDNKVNLNIVVKMLSDEYNIMCADNGQHALEMLDRKASIISAVLLDISMPILNGYDFLKIYIQKEEYKNLPVIVMTGSDDKESEKKALMLGAWDFVSKPFDAVVMRFRLRNAISRSQLSAFNRLRYLADYDELTGAYNRNKFFLSVEEALQAQAGKKHALVRFDINRFQLVNTFYGNEEGDKVLCFVAKILNDICNANPERLTFGRIDADNFGYCQTYESEQQLLDMVNTISEAIKTYPINFKLASTFGIYKIVDDSLSVSLMFGMATTAAKRAKITHEENCVFYDEKMGLDIEREQFISNSMQQALDNNQFVVYLQPKIDLKTRMACGAEALVRWKHPEKGLIPPGEFIPVFERNGFIFKLDFCVYENVCKKLRSWIDQGITPYPVSVNVSRANIYNTDLVGSLCKLTKKYNVDNKYLNLEITESVYTENPQLLHDVVEQLRREGFVVMMDDFGAGYSSLNMLKFVEVDVLKIDLGFLSDSGDRQKGRNIITSVVDMAKKLNLPVVAEGVEQAEQAEFLTSIGCEYAQGYFFDRPMPCEQYESKELMGTTSTSRG